MYLACIHGLANLLPNKDAWKRDWSDAGLQFLGLNDPFWGPHNPDPIFVSYWGSTIQPYFPWDYNQVVVNNGILTIRTFIMPTLPVMP